MSNQMRVSTDFAFRAKDGYKRPTVSVEYPAPTAAGLVEKLQAGDDKLVELLVDSVHNVLRNHIRSYVDNDLDFSQETLDTLIERGEISLEYIANMPRADRNVLNKGDLERFVADYVAIMPEATGKEEARVVAAANLFATRFKTAAGDNDVLAVLKSQLEIFVNAIDEEVADRNEKVITWASQKLDDLMSIKVTADAL